MRQLDQLRRDRLESNPVFGPRKLKLGTFQTNLDSACTMTMLPERFRISWPNTLAAAQLADEMGFEAIVPVARWRGFGGKTNPQGAGFEPYTWAAGLGASTRKVGITSTSHVSLNHPIVAAKQSTVIDHITGGRFMLNIVTGWNKPEIDMFGPEILPHDERYDMSEEWLSIVLRLWTEDEEFDHEGKYYKIKKGYLEPKPIQSPYPALMNAGNSERGRHFAAKNCDIVFINVSRESPAERKVRVDGYRKLAREEYGREIRVWTLVHVIQGETEAEAHEFRHHYVDELGDWEAAANAVETMNLTHATLRTIDRERMARQIAGFGSLPLIGTREQVVDGLQQLSDIGMDGVLLSWPRYLDDMRVFRDKTYPLLVQAGLR